MRASLLGFLQEEIAIHHPDADVEKGSLVESGILDSLGIMKLVDFVEKQFSLHIDDDDLLPENFETLNDIVALLETKRGQ